MPRHFSVTSYSGTEEPYVIPQLGDYTNGQLERCPSTGKLHWQLYVYTRRETTVAALAKKYGVSCQAARNLKALKDYVNKDESRVWGPGEWGEAKSQGKRSDLDGAILTYNTLGKRACATEHPATFAKYFRGLDAQHQAQREPYVPNLPSLRSHQQDVLDELLSDGSDRRIYSVVDSTGGSGKSTLVRFLRVRHGAWVSDGDGGYGDWAYDYDMQPVAVFDLPKAMEIPKDLGRFCEALSNEFIFSKKYESKTKVFKRPKIIIFSNSPIPALTWTHDRLKVYDWSHHGILQEGIAFHA